MLRYVLNSYVCRLGSLRFSLNFKFAQLAVVRFFSFTQLNLSIYPIMPWTVAELFFMWMYKCEMKMETFLIIFLSDTSNNLMSTSDIIRIDCQTILVLWRRQISLICIISDNFNLLWEDPLQLSSFFVMPSLNTQNTVIVVQKFQHKNVRTPSLIKSVTSERVHGYG